MKNKSSYNNFGYALTNYLSIYLPNEGGVGINTILSYRDTFKLFIKYLATKNINPNKITFENFERNNIISFLEWLENERNCSISTRNNRLSALHGFARYLLIYHPEYMSYANIIIGIKKKRDIQKSVGYLSDEEISTILSLAKEKSKRDYTLLAVLYYTGCRVQELCDLKAQDINFKHPSTIKVIGKGNKVRIIPITDKLSSLVKDYQNNFNTKLCDSLFFNHSNQKLSREGITYILKKYVSIAKNKSPELYTINVTPHIIRHSRAMHLLKVGVDLIYIRDILGHSELKTTEIYARIDSEMKRVALLKANDLIDTETDMSWHQNQNLLDWLNNLKK